MSIPEPTTISVAVADVGDGHSGWQRIRAEQTWPKVPLALHRSIAPVSGWTVTHIPTGRAIYQGIKRKRLARAIMRRLAGIPNWENVHYVSSAPAFVAWVKANSPYLWEQAQKLYQEQR